MIPQFQWWWSRTLHDRLSLWAAALLLGRRYRILLKNPVDAPGMVDMITRVITIDPLAFRSASKASFEHQLPVIQGLVAHEVGHVLFSEDIRIYDGDMHLQMMANILEDERIERCVSILYPGVRRMVSATGRACYSEIIKNSGKVKKCTPQTVADLCLHWRWASRFSNEAKMLQERSPDACQLWATVRPLVEEAWDSPHTFRVKELADQILKILGRDAVGGLAGWCDLPGERGSAPPLPVPRGESSDQPGDFLLSGLAEGEASPETNPPLALGCKPQEGISSPQPYLELEKMARPLANQLTARLKLPEPDVQTAAHEWRGRFNCRQDLRTPETPNRVAAAPGCTSRSLAFYVLVDRSGSMDNNEKEVKVALMALYLACEALGIPCGVAFFGQNSGALGSGLPLCQEIVPFGAVGELPRAMIAGYRGETGAEFLYAGLELGQQRLQIRPERVKILIVIHDGQPVVTGDRKQSIELVRQYERQGILVSGLYIGSDGEDAAACAVIFPHFIHCQPEQLPQTLGTMLLSLAQ